MRIDPSKMENLEERVVSINRVAKVVSGGKNFRFSVVVVVGDKKGHVGVGKGKAAEIPDAIRKAIESAKKNLIRIPIVNDTIPHEVLGHFGAGEVIMKPAREGTGVIAGGPLRLLFEVAGIKNIRTKSVGSNNARNMLNAAFEGLKSLRTVEEVAKLRGKTVDEILG